MPGNASLPTGLTDAAVVTARAAYGRNVLTAAAHSGLLATLREVVLEPMFVLLVTAGQLRQTLRNVTQSTDKLNESMTALQGNFLLRGYFRHQAKQQARATADSLQQVERAQ
ncbi:cation-transporting P-type ATPase [Hymenobacter terrestris]|uniref:Cation-transporting P-type ATPase N-terminal domain-containing protein n=1 Tax=Hymenobacter terrestris TaxID=2748310 RepID=A0ABX2Q7K5_9BACT|nr:cation-transporting P-type ATPase [Hymenobacter terrestris]NVO86222.1 hypothetical protein [Hymenobacter terrestris]